MAPGPAWHIPFNEEPFGGRSMRDPCFPVDTATTVTIFSGNQDRGEGGANQWQQGSYLSYKRLEDKEWTRVDLQFVQAPNTANPNNKYYSAQIPLTKYALGNQILYYLVLAYGTARDVTYLGVRTDDASGWFSAPQAEASAQARPFNFTIGDKNAQIPFEYIPKDRKVSGEWGKLINLPVSGAHASLLKDKTVLMWGRRDNSAQDEQSMNTWQATALRSNGRIAPAATCAPFVLDTDTGGWNWIDEPFMAKDANLSGNFPGLKVVNKADKKKREPGQGKNANLFCSGHTFQPDGKLLVVGGHLRDGVGHDQACTYDPDTGKWNALPVKLPNGGVMGVGRWYPTVILLPDGSSLVASGSSDKGNVNITQKVENNGFTNISDQPEPLDLYPKLHLNSKGLVYWISQPEIKYLDPKTRDGWRSLRGATNQRSVTVIRDYAPSVMYEPDKVAFFGGSIPPIASVEMIELNGTDGKDVVSKRAKDMAFARRQHNATILPDGTVLVTGGTRGSGNFPTTDDVSFNDLRPGRPVRVPELWDPSKVGKDGEWTTMATEQIDRCYHGTAVLLPDARVLSAGGGEFQLGGVNANPPEDTKMTAQIFSPPYLFRETRPNMGGVNPSNIELKTVPTIEVSTSKPADIGKVTLVGLSSVTHCVNAGQRFLVLEIDQRKVQSLTVKTPADANVCPPGYYMLFLVNKDGVPSEAAMVQITIKPTKGPAPKIAISSRMAAKRVELAPETAASSMAAEKVQFRTLHDYRYEVREVAKSTRLTRIEIGITASCPYGLSACWANAFQALSRMSDVEHVDPLPHPSGSTASVFLRDNGLPDLDRWTKEFNDMVQNVYNLRGYEAQVEGTVELRDDSLVLVAEGSRPEVRLLRIQQESKIQWDMQERRPLALTEQETTAYDELVKLASSGDSQAVIVTGPVRMTKSGSGADYDIQVRSIR